MPGEELEDLSEQERMNYAKEFAASNPSVTELLFYSPDDEEEIHFRFRVARDAEGKITDMVELLKNGMSCRTSASSYRSTDFAYRRSLRLS